MIGRHGLLLSFLAVIGLIAFVCVTQNYERPTDRKRRNIREVCKALNTEFQKSERYANVRADESVSLLVRITGTVLTDQDLTQLDELVSNKVVNIPFDNFCTVQKPKSGTGN